MNGRVAGRAGLHWFSVSDLPELARDAAGDPERQFQLSCALVVALPAVSPYANPLADAAPAELTRMLEARALCCDGCGQRDPGIGPIDLRRWRRRWLRPPSTTWDRIRIVIWTACPMKLVPGRSISPSATRSRSAG